MTSIPVRGISRRIGPRTLGLFLVALFAVLYGSGEGWPGTLRDRLEWVAYDLRARLSPFDDAAADAPVVVVEIDDASLHQLGRWPWPRARLARLTQRLLDSGAAVVALDMILAEAEVDPVTEVLDGLASQGIVLAPDTAEAMARVRADHAGDERLAAVLRDQPVVLGLTVNFADAPAQGALPTPLLEVSGRPQVGRGIPAFSAYSGNLELLQEAGGLAGAISVRPDADGVIRRVPLLFRSGEKIYGSLALETVLQYLGIRELGLLRAPASSGAGLEAISLAGLQRIPTDSSGQMLIPYRSGSPWFARVSAAAVLAGDFEPRLFDSAIVIVGTTAAGLHDLRSTPVDQLMPGVHIQASIVAGLLNGGVPHASRWMTGADIFLLLVVGITLALLLPRLRPVVLLVTALAAVALIVAGNLWAWREHGLVFSLALPAALVFWLTLLNLGWGFAVEQRDRRQLKAMFGEYVPAAHIDRMLDDPGARSSLAGEDRQLTVLFADIRDFTTISEAIGAHELKRFLDFYFTPLTEAVFRHDGTIDKYVGDMIMAFWGAPLDDPDHRRNAVGAALEMLHAADGLKAALKERGWPEIRIGIGVNSGVMSVGDMGSRYRRNYTVIGDAVNLGSRVEGLSKHYGVPLLISEFTAQGLEQGFLLRRIDRVRVKGKREAVTLLQPLCASIDADDRLRDRAEVFDQALEAYFAARWDDAEALLRRAGRHEADRVLCDVFLGRIDQLRAAATTDGEWDGVFVHRQK